MNYELSLNNKVYLCGKVANEPVFSHEIYGEGFYDINLEVPRLSTQSDIIPITVSERLFKDKNLKIGETIAVLGQFRSYNKLIDNKSKLILTVFVREICNPIPDLNCNIVELVGFVCKEPVFRTTPFRREICDMLLAVNRAYNKSDYLPCIAWGRNARFVSELSVGQKVYLTGRIQSREYQKKTEDGVENKTAFEVSISKISLDNNIDRILEDQNAVMDFDIPANHSYNSV